MFPKWSAATSFPADNPDGRPVGVAIGRIQLLPARPITSGLGYGPRYMVDDEDVSHLSRFLADDAEMRHRTLLDLFRGYAARLIHG